MGITYLHSTRQNFHFIQIRRKLKNGKHLIIFTHFYILQCKRRFFLSSDVILKNITLLERLKTLILFEIIYHL